MGSRIPMPPPRIAIKPALHSSEIKNFPFLGICAKCRRVAWFKNCSRPGEQAQWGHDCDPFASPYAAERVWDARESISAHQLNLVNLIMEANHLIQEKFGSSAHLAQSLPQLPPLYWPLTVSPDLYAYTYPPPASRENGEQDDTGTPFLALCPRCRRIVWYSDKGDVTYHWPINEHDGTPFSVSAIAEDITNVDDTLRAALERRNDHFSKILRTNPSLRAKLTEGQPLTCIQGMLPRRIPCRQFAAAAHAGEEVWAEHAGVERHHSVAWQKKATDLHLHLLTKFGTSPHFEGTLPRPPALDPGPSVPPLRLSSGPFPHDQPVWPWIEDPDVREIVDFRDQMQSFFDSKRALLPSAPMRPHWFPRSPVKPPYRAFPESNPPEPPAANFATYMPPIYPMIQPALTGTPVWSPVSSATTLYIETPGAFHPPLISLTPGVSDIPLTPLYAETMCLVPLSSYLCVLPFNPTARLYMVMSSLPPKTEIGE